MRLLVACEESQEVTTAFRNLGYEAYLCQHTLNGTYKETYCHCWNNTGTWL